MAKTYKCFAVRGKDGAYVGQGSSMAVVIWTSDLLQAELFETGAEAHAIAHELGNGAEVVECEATLERDE